jgi:hypothetical protein
MQHRRGGNLPKLNAGLLSKNFRILSSFCLALALAGSCLAQVDRSALNGMVTDPSGRVLPGAEVVAVQGTFCADKSSRFRTRRECETILKGCYGCVKRPRLARGAITFRASL